MGEEKRMRRTLTQRFPFLWPLRKWQRETCFYLKMKLDGVKYAGDISEEILKYPVFETESLMLNQNSGFDMKYQYNKIHNLKLVAEVINNLIIRPGETFSFCRSAKHADRDIPFKDGLSLLNGQIVGEYGGGICQISTMLFWMFLHSPLSIAERHCHDAEEFPSTTPELPVGTDATVSEGWLDLKVRNDSPYIFQIRITFDDDYMYGQLLSDIRLPYSYEIFNDQVSYSRTGGRVYRWASVDRMETSRITGKKRESRLYDTKCEIGYKLPRDIEIIAEGE